MNHPNLKLKIAVVTMFVFAFSSLASVGYASEVTGTLSSSGDHSTNNQNNPPQDEENENISGSVVPAANSGGGGGGSTSSGSSNPPDNQSGSVLGASTYDPSPNTGNSYVYPISGTLTAGNSANTGNYELAQLPAIEENAGISQTETLPSLTPVETQEGGISSWFWIILLSLLLIGVVGYFYSRPVDRMQSI